MTGRGNIWKSRRRRARDIAHGQRPLKAANAPASDTGIEVGTTAAVKNGGKIAWPSDRLVFDITDAVKRFGGQETTVLLIPIGSGRPSPRAFPALKYDKMQIITRQP